MKQRLILVLLIATFLSMLGCMAHSNGVGYCEEVWMEAVYGSDSEFIRLDTTCIAKTKNDDFFQSRSERFMSRLKKDFKYLNLKEDTIVWVEECGIMYTYCTTIKGTKGGVTKLGNESKWQPFTDVPELCTLRSEGKYTEAEHIYQSDMIFFDTVFNRDFDTLTKMLRNTTNSVTEGYYITMYRLIIKNGHITHYDYFDFYQPLFWSLD